MEPNELQAALDTLTSAEQNFDGTREALIGVEQDIVEEFRRVQTDPIGAALDESHKARMFSRRQRVVERERRTNAERALAALEDAIRTAEPLHATMVRTSEEPAGVFASWGDGKQSYSRQEYALLMSLEEQRIARFERDFAQAPASVLLDEYRAAVEDPAPAHSGADSFVRWFERRHSRGFAGKPTTVRAELEAARQLGVLVRETRESRIPQSLRDAEAQFHRARVAVQRGRDLLKLQARREARTA